jgi:hypothetical protein
MSSSLSVLVNNIYKFRFRGSPRVLFHVRHEEQLETHATFWTDFQQIIATVSESTLAPYLSVLYMSTECEGVSLPLGHWRQKIVAPFHLHAVISITNCIKQEVFLITLNKSTALTRTQGSACFLFVHPRNFKIHML